jgi:hypothetical protein
MIVRHNCFKIIVAYLLLSRKPPPRNFKAVGTKCSAIALQNTDKKLICLCYIGKRTGICCSHIKTLVGAFHGILPQVANIDNRSATVLICKCPLLCNNIPIATHTRNSTALSLLWYGSVNSAQQRTAFSNGSILGPPQDMKIYVEDASVSKTTRTSSGRQHQGSSATYEEACWLYH